MATNPMQRKANNYLLIGILGTLLITGSIIVFLFLQLNNLQQEKKKEQTAVKQVYVLNTNIKSGEEITLDKVNRIQIPASILAKYHIGHSVALLGVGDHFEIWDLKAYQEYEKQALEEFEDVAENLENGK